MQILIVLLGIISLVLLITKWKLDPFISILMVSLGLGLFLGQNPTTVIDSMIKGVGGLLGELSLVLGLGAQHLDHRTMLLINNSIIYEGNI
ncbi:hypothetical protein [Leuconostoc suionicum]|uniref:GntT/GntP/DsdX family permease n=1 Tax=Leuconostoc suionicum TaxID=1511761 RepID=UPI0032E0110C